MGAAQWVTGGGHARDWAAVGRLLGREGEAVVLYACVRMYGGAEASVGRWQGRRAKQVGSNRTVGYRVRRVSGWQGPGCMGDIGHAGKTNE